MAANCFVVPLAMLGFVGVTAIDTSVAGVTVRVVDPDMLPDVAVIVDVPAAAEVASPELFIVATSAFDECQVTNVVTSIVVPSEYVPVAVSCWAVLRAILELVGVIEIEVSEVAPLSHDDRPIDKIKHDRTIPIINLIFMAVSCISFCQISNLFISSGMREGIPCPSYGHSFFGNDLNNG